MRYYTIAFLGDEGQHIQETWSEQNILLSAWGRHWVTKMQSVGKLDQICDKNLIDDWIVVHWGVETGQFGDQLPVK